MTEYQGYRSKTAHDMALLDAAAVEMAADVSNWKNVGYISDEAHTFTAEKPMSHASRRRPCAASAQWVEAEAPAGKPCPTCTWPNRETVDMVCQTCGTDYSLPENAGPMPETSAAHVMPFDDLVAHMPTEDCPCGPAVEAVMREDGSNGWVYTHHSLDGREASA